MSKLLIINADDLGLSKEINSGILWGLGHGFVSDTSLLVKAVYTNEAVTGLKALGLSHAGIHINLDELFGWSPGGIEHIARPELLQMLSDPGFLQRCAREAREQIEAFLSFRLVPTHADTHHHVHGFFSIFRILVDLLKEYGIPALRFSRHGYRLPTRKDIPYENESYKQMQDLLRRSGIAYCPHFLEGAAKVHEAHEGVTELVVHPSLGGDPWRSEEFDILESKARADGLGHRGIKQVSFRELLQERDT